MSIETPLQRSVSERWLEQFRQTIRDHDAATRPDDVHPTLWHAQRAALVSQVEDLERDIAEYDAALSHEDR